MRLPAFISAHRWRAQRCKFFYRSLGTAEIARNSVGLNPAHGGNMPTITTFRQLILWQKSMDLAVRAYDMARKFPRSEQMVLGYQIRKSAVSMPSNVAEGFSRHSTPFYVQHLWTAHASGAELETQVEVGRRIRIVSEPEAETLIADAQEVARMINGLVRSLQRAPCT